MSNLLTVDLSNLVIRHASNPYRTETDNTARPVGGAVGALTQVLNLIKEVEPTHILLAKDGHRSKIFRTQIDSAYKAHRTEAPEEIKHNFAVTYKAIELLEWPILAVEGYEADDIIASAVRSFDSEGGRSLVVSGDKDLLALCSKNTTVRLLGRGDYRDCSPTDCKDIFGILPERVADYKSLVGDASDGIRGVEGIGPKRALALLNEYSNLDNILAAIESLKEGESLKGTNAKITQMMVSGMLSAKTSYELATIVDSLEIDFDSLLLPNNCSNGIDDSLIPELNDFGLESIVQRLNYSSTKPIKSSKQELNLEKTFEAAFLS